MTDSSASSSDTMQAIVYDEYCAPADLTVRNVPVPTVDDDEVLLAVQAVSLNPADWHFVTGLPYLARTSVGLWGPKNPIPGIDVAGRVAAVGPKVTRFKVGDEVFGYRHGCLAQYVAVAQDQVTLRPENVTPEQACTMGVAAFTALQGLRDCGRLQEGQHVLITGASGGVGTLAIQIAKAFGAEVTAVCRTKHVDMVRSLGADHVIDYTTEDFVTIGQADGTGRYDVMLDNVGNRSLADCRKVMTDSGRCVLVSGPKGNLLGPFPRVMKAVATSLFNSKKMLFFLAKETSEDLEVLRDYLSNERVMPVIERTYPLAETPEALTRVGEGHTAGKIVVTI